MKFFAMYQTGVTINTYLVCVLEHITRVWTSIEVPQISPMQTRQEQIALNSNIVMNLFWITA